METTETPGIHHVVVLISANVEWRLVRQLLQQRKQRFSPLGEWFTRDFSSPASSGELMSRSTGESESVLFFHGGWGKIAAAASTQYVIDHCEPQVVINLGTCGGIRGCIERGSVILVEQTLVYDLRVQIGEVGEAVSHYTTTLDLSWLETSYPQPVQRTLLVSGDRDLVAEEVANLRAQYGAVAADWESAAIAYVAHQNNTRCLILRGVTDLVGPEGGDAYTGSMDAFVKQATPILRDLLEALPTWIRRVRSVH